MQKCRSLLSPKLCVYASHSPLLFSTVFMDVHSLTFSLIESTPPLHVFPPFSFPSFPAFALGRLLSTISLRLTSLAVTLDFKELLHSSVTHRGGRGGVRCCAKRGGNGERVYKKEGERLYEKRERRSALDRGGPRSHKSKEGPRSHFHTLVPQS